MHIDVLNTVLINRSVADVSQYAADPDNAPLWYENIKSVEWKTPRPVQLGSQLDFVAHFLGRRLAYTYEIVEFVPGRRLTMRTPGPPFSMQTTYTWENENRAVLPVEVDVCRKRDGSEPVLAAQFASSDPPHDSKASGGRWTDRLAASAQVHRVRLSEPEVRRSDPSAPHKARSRRCYGGSASA
jgi:hypothetical protein